MNKKIFLSCHWRIHVYKRGEAILYFKGVGNSDNWNLDSIKKEEDDGVPFHKREFYVAHVLFGDLQKNQRALVEEVKKVKKAKVYEQDEEEEKEKTFNEKTFEMLINYELTNESLLALCKHNGKKMSSVKVSMNNMLRDKGIGNSVGHYLKKTKEEGVEVLPGMPDDTFLD
jgi:hypothetical protein